jgi:predicted ArsR family transcriptional regulator
LTVANTIDDPTTLARRDGAESSRLAAERVVAAGTPATQRALIYATLQATRQELTSNEIAHRCGLRGDKVQKRMAELERAGLVVRGPVRACAFGYPAHGWRISIPAIGFSRETGGGVA